jgi:CheY-like chemotaxis protein/signal transduction histidine kinase
MNPLYLILDRLTKKLEQQTDLEVVNRILYIYLYHVTFGVACIAFSMVSFARENAGTLLASVLLVSAALLTINLIIFHFTRQSRFCKSAFITLISILTFFFLYTGGPLGTGFIWVLFFPVVSIPLFGLSRGNLISFIFFVLLIVYFTILGYIPGSYELSAGLRVMLPVAYAIVHLLIYFHEYLKLHNSHSMTRSIIETRNEIRQKDDFLSKLSHQIRTPLNNLTVVSNLVSKSKLDPELRDLFDTIMASTINLINVVNNIVKVSEVKIEKEAGSQVSFDLYASIAGIFKLFRDQYKERIDINFHFSKNIKTNYIGDPIRIKQIFLNIIENIIKALPDQKITIDASVEAAEDHERDTLLSFSMVCPKLHLESDDYGNYYTRFSSEQAQEQNYQPDDYLVDFIIAKKIVEYYGGEFIIEVSDYSTTMNFSFILKKDLQYITPKTPEPEKAVKQLLPLKRKIALKDANILLVEDNAINQKIIILSLKNMVKNIDVANNGKDALDKFGITKYDLILMDIQMPIINGIVATKKIRELEATSNTQTPIIAITANALSGDKENCLAAGMNDYVSKPFQVEQLVQKMQNLLQE